MIVYIYKIYRLPNTWKLHFEVRVLMTLLIIILLAGCSPANKNILVINGIFPSSGRISGGTLLTISGSGFISGAVVIIGSKSCAIVSSSLSQMTCTSPANVAGLYSITITNLNRENATLASAYTYQVAPTVTSISPVSGFTTGLTPVTITGSGFLAGATVLFGGTVCTGPTVVSAALITCTPVAHAAGVVNVVVTNTDTQSGTSTSAYTYRAVPTVTNVAANAGALTGGTFVTITGTGFYTGSTITFGGTACLGLIVVSTTSITCTTAAHAAGTVNVIVTNADSQTGTGLSAYTYQAAPTVTSISPVSGFATGLTPVTITGSGFLTGTTASFGGIACGSLTVVSATLITCTTAAHSAGSVSATVTNSDTQSGSAAAAYTYVAAPAVLIVSPNSGALAGGAAVTITGSGFNTGAIVTFGGTACVSVVIVSSSLITCTTPAHVAGAVNIVITNTDTQAGTSTSVYTYRAAPAVTSIAASAGALAGGTFVTITGTGFYTGSTITFGGTACLGLIVVSTTSITCTTAAHAAGTVNVIVTNADTQTGTGLSAYTYQAAPTITSISPVSGFATGLTPVTITGSGFLAGATVLFGGTVCTGPTVVSATSITCTTAAHAAGVVNVVVTNTDTQTGTSISAYIYRAAPTVTSIAVSAGALTGGTAVTITGSGFYTGVSLTFGGIACTVPVVVSATSITCTTPAHAAGAVNVIVTNADTQTGTGLSVYTYQAAPTVANVTPNAGALGGGIAVTITGSGFLAGAITFFGGTACTGLLVINPTTITCTTPLQLITGAVNVIVTNSDSQTGTLANGYTYNLAPAVTNISANSGPLAGGTVVTITGSGFLAGATASFGGIACASLTLVSATSIICTTPAHAAGAVNVVITNTDTQSGTGTSAYTYRAAPAVTSIAANAGALAGGTAVTIIGSGFYTGATVTFGGTACASITIVNATSITCITPAHAAGAVNVIITNSDTQTGTGFSVYTYQAIPIVTSVSPSAGSLAGLATVNITGSGFVTGANVTFGGAACTAPVVISATSITCSTPSHTAGFVAIVVTNTDAQSATLTNGYIYIPGPTVSTVTSNSGALAGGTAVTIVGTNFIAGAIVDFSGSACASVVVVSSTSITCTTSAHVAGAVTVKVTNSDSQFGSAASAYTYRVAPTVTSVSPNSGTLAGGGVATITGTGFYTGAIVDFGGSACAAVTVVSTTSITCTLTAHAAGAITVTVTNSDTQFGSVASAYTYQAAPTVTSVAVGSGFASGGTGVTITGTGFIVGAIVDFGGSTCTGITVVGLTSITCTTAAHAAGTVNVTVTNTDAQSGIKTAAYTYVAAPAVSTVSLNSGALAGGTAVAITGSGFLTGPAVTFGGTACTAITFVSPTSITCTTPAHAAGAVNVVVTNTDTQSGTALSAYSYRAAPIVTSASPLTGVLAGGTAVTITGSGFYSGATASVGGSACANIVIVSSTSITCTTAAHAAGAVAVSVTNVDTQSGSAAAAFTYQAAPTITSLTPASGFAAGGTAVTITGTGFLVGATASFGGTTCTSLTVVSSSSITCTTAVHAAGVVNVVVTNTDTQTGTAMSGYTYMAAPAVTNILPAAGSINGATAVTITGTAFNAGAAVAFGGTACASITVVSPTSITCITGAHVAGVMNVVVTNTDTQMGTLTSGFTYQSMADLKWQVGLASPTPANPDSYGTTSTNVTHTYTLKNTGDIATTTITLSKTGTSPAAWLFGTDTCSGTTLAANATCTVQVTFLGQFLTPATAYSAVLNGLATGGGTTTNNMNGSTP